MKDLLDTLKLKVTESASRTDFIHHEWFVEYHLNLVEKIALELCSLYKEADKDIVLALVWIHDYSKILDKEREHDQEMFDKAKGLLIEIGFKNNFINKIIELLTIFESKMTTDLHEAPIEVRIVSSADAASHFIGPFFSIYYRENSTTTTPELMASTRKKILKDWDRKIVLPEIKEAFRQRFDLMMEQTGNFPEKYL